MSRQVHLDERATDQAAAFLPDDPEGLRAVLAAIDALGEYPYPDDAFPFGSTGLRRLRIRRCRCFSVADDLITVGHIARAPRQPLTFRDPVRGCHGIKRAAN